MPPFPYETEEQPEEEVFAGYALRDPETEERVRTESHLPENRQDVRPASPPKERAGSRLPLLRSPETAREAVLYAEIFGRPKALRRRNR